MSFISIPSISTVADVAEAQRIAKAICQADLAVMLTHHHVHQILTLLKVACLSQNPQDKDGDWCEWDYALRTAFEQQTGNAAAAWGVKDD